MSLLFQIQVPLQQHHQHKSNYISTTKYNLITFLPLSLIIQFKRYANIYFLVCAVLQCIPLLSPLNPFSAVAPLIFVLLLSMVREGVEDYRRYKSDQKDNKQITHAYTHTFVQTKWQDLKSGMLIRIQKDEIISADTLVLLSSSSSGISYVQTSSLDGEKNLKPKLSNALLQKRYNETFSLPSFDNIQGRIKCVEPSAEIQAFDGQVELRINDMLLNQRINKKNMLLRGCKLRNTDWAIGIVIYTGEDTAIMMNGSQPFTKTSNIQRKVNNVILMVFGFEVLCSAGSAIYGYYGCNSEYLFGTMLLGGPIDCSQQAGIAFSAYFILYSTFIPISLIVSLEFVKIFQGYFMAVDKEMHCSINNRDMASRTVSINEQLGQVQYILTDKTGTLTCNKMQFRNIVIGRQMYGEQLNFDPIGHIDYEMLVHKNINHTRERSDSHFNDRSLSYDLSSNRQEKQTSMEQMSSKRQLIQLMFTMIATCHECIPVKEGDFEGPSPDEVALLKAAYNVGFRFISCENKVITVQYNQNRKVFELLRLLEFDSDRKRMSVVVRTQNSICVFVKGADTNIQKILLPKQKYLQDIRQKTYQMTKTGLRSLWFAYKTYPFNRDVSTLKPQEIQSDLTLVGATGIEDKLQDFVPQTIFSLREAGIKIIMLTGDKLQTAQNIALACKLIQEGYLIRGKKDLENFTKILNNLQLRQTQATISPVIDGSTISFIQNEQQLKNIIEQVKSVVFCRVTPGQKAEIVRFVKNMGKLTLAIGDGANDVNMILQANVGVGIYGEEGTRAAQVANYAIGEFCLLWKLLLYHGRLNYIRITEMILYFFYKNMVFTTVQFAFCFYCLGSGQSFWLSWSITFYNLAFTLFPVVIRAVFEVDVDIAPTKATFHQLSQGTHENQLFYSYYPRMYFVSQKNKLFNNAIFFAWFFLGFCQGVICLLFTIYAIGDLTDTSGSDSFGVGFYLVEISAYTSVIIVVTIKIAVNVKHWSVILILGFALPSIGLYILFTFVLGLFEDAATYESMVNLLQMPSFYMAQFLCIGCMFSFDFLLFSLKSTKQSFQNYLKFKTLKKQRLSQTNLQHYMMQMYKTADQTIQL